MVVGSPGNSAEDGEWLENGLGLGNAFWGFGMNARIGPIP